MAVIDLDRHHEGQDGIAALAGLGLDPDALSHATVTTPSGGRHLYFAWPSGLTNAAGHLPAGIDIRGQGGYVIAPGARVADGQAYSDTRLADLPAFPAALLPPRRKPVDDFADLLGEPQREPDDWELVDRAMRYLDPACDHDEWRNVGMALEHESAGSIEGFDRWDKWSRQCADKYPGKRDMRAQWRSFTRGRLDRVARGEAAITIDTLFHHARERGFDPIEYEDLGEEPQAEMAVATAPVEFTKLMRSNGKLISNQHNAVALLLRDVESILPGLALNLMTGQTEWQGGAITDHHVTLARIKLEKAGLKQVGKELVADAIGVVARVRQYHPIRDWLTGLHHDGKPRLDSWLSDFLSVEASDYSRAIGRMFLIQMVARVMRPGCKADYTLSLSGKQGMGKSTACRILAGERYFSDTLPGIGHDRTEAVRHLRGKWLVELAELAPARKSENEDLKSFLSGAVDRIRLPYARLDESFERQCVFVGTTNEDEYLRDATGGRRYWPVHVRGAIDLSGLEKARDQLFAEAFAAFTAGEEWWPDREFEAEFIAPQQEAVRESDAWRDTIAEWLSEPDDDDGQRDHVRISDVLTFALAIPVERHSRASDMRASAIMRVLGWQKHKTKRWNVWKRGKVDT